MKMKREDFIKLLPYEPEFKIVSDKINKARGNKVVVEDKYGRLEIRTEQLIKGVIPSMRHAINKTEYVTNMFKDIFDGKYNYHNYTFTNTASRVYFTCPIHGAQDIYYKYHIKGRGCKDCMGKLGSPSTTNEEFLSRIKELGMDVEVLEEYAGYHTKILCRNKYGLIKVSPGNLYKGIAGSLRTAVDKTEYMKRQFLDIHGGKYDYSKYIYKGNREYGTIICREHGEFEQLTDVHLMGSGCAKCASNSVNNTNKGYFLSNTNNRDCKIYISKLRNRGEVFYKIGATTRTIEERLVKSEVGGYSQTPVYSTNKLPPEVAWKVEKELLTHLQPYRYTPANKFKGYTECVKGIEEEYIINKLNKIILTNK